MYLLRNIFFIFIFLISQEAISQKILSSWKLAKQSNDINISYRLLEIGDTLETRQMGIWFTTNATPDELIKMFNDVNNFSEWSAGVKKCKIVHHTTNSWLTYNLYDIPWPFEQKDLVTEYKLERFNNSTILYMSSKPNSIPKYAGVSRLQNYQGKWIFTPTNEGLTKVSFYSISFSKRVLPKFVQDPVIQNVFIDSIQKLKTLLEQ